MITIDDLMLKRNLSAANLKERAAAFLEGYQADAELLVSGYGALGNTLREIRNDQRRSEKAKFDDELPAAEKSVELFPVPIMKKVGISKLALEQELATVIYDSTPRASTDTMERLIIAGEVTHFRSQLTALDGNETTAFYRRVASAADAPLALVLAIEGGLGFAAMPVLRKERDGGMRMTALVEPKIVEEVKLARASKVAPVRVSALRSKKLAIEAIESLASMYLEGAANEVPRLREKLTPVVLGIDTSRSKAQESFLSVLEA